MGLWRLLGTGAENRQSQKHYNKHKTKHTQTHKKYNQHKTISTNNCCLSGGAFVEEACSFCRCRLSCALCFLSFSSSCSFENPQLKTKQHVPAAGCRPVGLTSLRAFAARVFAFFSVCCRRCAHLKVPIRNCSASSVETQQRKRHTTTTCFNQQTQPATPENRPLHPKQHN